jgi:dihydropyrimidine dehydrogenase (NAD+) subunit PreT
MSAHIASREGRRTLTSIIVALFCLSFLACFTAVMAWRGWSFYRLATDARFDHPDYRLLSPSSRVGRAYGEIGASLVFVNLFYLARRRLAGTRLGSMRAWLDLHVFTGIVASIFVLFHSAFQLRTPMAMVTSASMALVVITGIIGRFLYAMSPRSEAHVLVQQLAAIEREAHGLGRWIERRLDSVRVTWIEPSLLHSLATIPRWIRQGRARYRAVCRAPQEWPDLEKTTPAQRARVLALCTACAHLARREVRSLAAGTILRSWRSMHRLFAILMLLTVVVHIGVAVYYGYGWGTAE